MKKLFFTLLFAVVLSSISASAQKVELEKVIIDKDNCTITRKSDGKTFNLYGRVEIVSSSYFADFSIEIVDSSADIDIRLITHTHPECCEFQKVTAFPTIKVAIVSHAFADLSVRLVDSYPCINH